MNLFIVFSFIEHATGVRAETPHQTKPRWAERYVSILAPLARGRSVICKLDRVLDNNELILLDMFGDI